MTQNHNENKIIYSVMSIYGFNSYSTA